MTQGWEPTLREGELIEEVPLSRWVGEALGAASSCWGNLRGAGVFDSVRAERISVALEARIEAALIEATARGYQRALEEAMDDGTVHGCSWCGELFGPGTEGDLAARQHVVKEHGSDVALLGATTKELYQEVIKRLETLPHGENETGTKRNIALGDASAAVKYLPEGILEARREPQG